jgi:hypothetical protein
MQPLTGLAFLLLPPLFSKQIIARNADIAPVDAIIHRFHAHVNPQRRVRTAKAFTFFLFIYPSNTVIS